MQHPHPLPVGQLELGRAEGGRVRFVHPEVRSQQPVAGLGRPVGKLQSVRIGLTVRKSSQPPGRSSRAASGTQPYGSHQLLAPYSDRARSKLPSGDRKSTRLNSSHH